MSAELYLDTARLGRMCPAAHKAEHDFATPASQLGSSLYLEWFLCHGYHPLRIVFVASDVNLQTIEATATDSSKRSNADPLYRFTRSLELAEFASFGETVMLSALIVAAGALRQAEREAAALHDPWEVLRTNAQSLASWVNGQAGSCVNTRPWEAASCC